MTSLTNSFTKWIYVKAGEFAVMERSRRLAKCQDFIVCVCVSLFDAKDVIYSYVYIVGGSFEMRITAPPVTGAYKYKKDKKRETMVKLLCGVWIEFVHSMSRDADESFLFWNVGRFDRHTQPQTQKCIFIARTVEHTHTHTYSLAQ
jgi:hypothetical protein